MVVCLLVGGGAIGQAEEPEFDVATVLNAWKDYKKSLRENEISADIKGLRERSGGKKGASLQKSPFQYKIQLSPVGQTSVTQSGVSGGNSRYRFRLASVGSNGYVIDELVPNEEIQVKVGPHPNGKTKEMVPGVVATMYAPLRMNGIHDFEMVLSSPSFKVTQVSEGKNKAGQRIVTIQFESPGTEVGPGGEVTGGTISFLPELNWLVDSSSLVSPVSEGKGKVNYELRTQNEIASINGLSLPTVTSHEILADGKTASREHRTITNYSFDPIDPDVFYLSHYGINEPGFVQPWYVHYKWYLVGLGCFALVVLLILLQIRKTRRSSH